MAPFEDQTPVPQTRYQTKPFVRTIHSGVREIKIKGGECHVTRNSRTEAASPYTEAAGTRRLSLHTLLGKIK